MKKGRSDQESMYLFWNKSGVCFFLFHTFLISLVFCSSLFGSEYQEEIEKVIPLRSNGKLQILNNRGDLSIEGWSQDKIRLSLKKKVVAETLDEAQRLLRSADVTQQVYGGNVEIAAKFGNGMTLQERFRERVRESVSLKMSLLAPAGRDLQILAMRGRISLKSWRGSVEIRSGQGEVLIENVRGREVLIVCPDCKVEARKIFADLRCVGGDQSLSFQNLYGDQVYIQSNQGLIRVQNIEGNQLYVTKAASILGQDLKGEIEFHARDGQVELRNVNGFVSGSTISGNISIRMAELLFRDKALLESISGNIFLALARSFIGELEMSSIQGKVRVELPIEPRYIQENTDRHFIGRAGRGTGQLRMVTEDGDLLIRSWK